MPDSDVPTLPEPEGPPSAVSDVPSVAASTDPNRGAEATATPQLTRRGRVRKWDRAPQPHDWRWFVGNVGKTLIAAGLLMFAFVGYQLYGTGIETAAAQNQLEDEFAQQLEQFGQQTDKDMAGTDAPDQPDVNTDRPATDRPATDRPDEPADTDAPDQPVVDDQPDQPVVDDQPDEPVVTDPPSANGEPEEPPAVEAVPLDQQNIPEIEDGDALARLEIPAIDTDDIVVAGVAKADLKNGPGHFADTPLPGQLGNTAIAGHRTTYGQPFRNVDRLVIGDEIRVTTPNGVFVYLVTDQQIVSPADYQVIATSDPTLATITLVSCHPAFTARERIIIFGELDLAQSSPVGAPLLNYGRDAETETPDELPGEEALPGEEELPDEDVAPDEPADTTAAPTTTDDAASAVDQPDEPIDHQPVPDSSTETPALANGVDQLGADQANASIADAFSEGWFSDPSANPQVGLWGLALAAIAIIAYAISRRFRRDLIGLAIGLVPFVLALYFFFQNVNRLLPPSL